MKESILLKAIAAINKTLPTVYDDDGALITFSILSCHNFYEIPAEMLNRDSLMMEDERAIEYLKKSPGSHDSPSGEMPPLIECKLKQCRVTDKDEITIVHYAIGWSNGSHSFPELFLYNIQEQA